MSLTLSHFLVLGAVLFAISVVGIFLNRRNLIVLLMAIELMLLAVNLNFIAFSHFLGNIAGQVFVFFILTVAAAESAIGLAILVVLFLFVVMMLDINIERVREGFWRNLPLALVVGVIMVWEMIAVVAYRYWGTGTPTEPPPGYSNTKALGRVLYTDYAYAFEIAGVLLLVAIVAAIALTLRRRKDSRSQDPSQQVRARREERVRLVNGEFAVDSEPGCGTALRVAIPFQPL